MVERATDLTMKEVERDANRFAAWVCLVFGLVVAVGALLGRFEPMFILAWRFIAIDLVFCTVPCLVVAAWSFCRGHVGAGIKWAAVAALVLSSSAILVSAVDGFVAFIFVIFVSCRYFRPKFVWGVFAAVLAFSILASIPHAAYGYMSFTPDERMLAEGAAVSFDMSRLDYWKSIMLFTWPTCLIVYFIATFISWRICIGGREMVARERAIQRRLADVERGLAIAASQYYFAAVSVGGEVVEKLNVEKSKGADRVGVAPETENFSTFPPFNSAERQPDVSGWTMRQISDCLAECKRRAAADPAFAALVERDPAAAVREATGTRPGVETRIQEDTSRRYK